MAPFETIVVDHSVVACNLNLGADGKIECPYCSRLFVLRGQAGSGHVAEMPPVTPSAHPPPAAPAKP
jgi:hypothetical protein